MKSPVVGAATLLVVGVALMSSSQAQQTLRIADYLPATHYLVLEGIKPWMEDVEAATQGKVKFQHFPSQQLGKATEILHLTETNVAQIGVTGISFASDKMELSDVAQLAGMFKKSCDGVHAYQKIAKDPAVASTDFDKNGVRLMFPIVLPPFQIFSHTRPINGPDDIKGMKVMVPMRSGELLLSKLGAAPIRLSSGPMAYEAMQRGTVDALVFAVDSVLTYDLQNMTKFGSRDSNFGGQAVVIVMNNQTWNALDQPTKDIIDRASNKAADRVCSYVDASNQKSMDKLIELGDKMVNFSQQSHDQMKAVSAEVAEAWAKELDAKGKPGTAILNSYRAALAAQ